MVNKFSKTVVLLTIVSLSSCAKSSISTTTSTGGGFSFDTDTSTDTNTTPVDYGTSYDAFNKNPGEFDQININQAEYVGYKNNELFDGYYSPLTSWDNGQDLKHKLFNIIYDEEVYVPNTYEGNWDTNRNADESLSVLDNVDVLYNVNSQGKNDTYSSSNTTGWNREHAFCASLLSGQLTANAVKTKGIATDFHNLFAANSGGNSSRSDKNLGKVSPSEDISKTGGYNLRPGYDYRFTTDKFEPNDTDKGMLARAILYMSVMYGKDSWNNNKYKVGDGVYLRENTCSIGEYCIGNSSTLVDWSNTYLVSRNEYKHSEYVVSEQHNRNPFVDFINLADYVYGNKSNQKGSINDLVSSVAYLGIDKVGVNNLAISNVKKEYLPNDVFSKDNLSVYKVNNDFSKELTNDYYVSFNNSVVTLPYTFTGDEGKINVKIYNDTSEITYQIDVIKTGLKACNNVHMFDSYITSNKSDSSSKDEIKSKKFTVNGSNWNITFDGCSPSESDVISSIGNDFSYGVKIGSTTKYCTSMSFVSDKIENINQIYFKGATAASTNESLTIAVLDDSNNIIETKSQTINRDKTEIGVTYANPVSGKILIRFNNSGHKAIYVTGLAFNTISD